MNYDEFMHIVLDSNRDDWLCNDDKGIFTYRQDLDIRIERFRSDEGYQVFTADWTNIHPDANAYGMIYELYYRSSFVKSFMLVAVDGYRAYLPLPDAQTKIIPIENYRLARICDILGTLDEYIQRSGLTVQQG